MKLCFSTVPDGGGRQAHFWCPACRATHSFWVDRPGGARPSWTYNGDPERPTFSPSLLIRSIEPPLLPGGERGWDRPHSEWTPYTVCHLHVVDGEIRYCGDNPHPLNGKTVPMEDIPESWGITPGCDEEHS